MSLPRRAIRHDSATPSSSRDGQIGEPLLERSGGHVVDHPVEAFLRLLGADHVRPPRITERERLDPIATLRIAWHGGEHPPTPRHGADPRRDRDRSADQDRPRRRGTEQHDAERRHDGAGDRRREEAIAEAGSGHGCEA